MGFSLIIKHGNLLNAALGDVTRRPLKSLVAAICIAAILLPVITALAISEGLRSQAAIGAKVGADFYLSSYLLGGEGLLPLNMMMEIANRQGVMQVRARVVGRTYFVDRLVAVVGLDRNGLEALKPLVLGRIPRARGEVLVGKSVAEAFGISPGPGMRFTLAANNRYVFTPTGTLAPSCLWGSDVLIVGLEDANAFFRAQDLATQLLVWADPRMFPGPEAASGRPGERRSGELPDLKIISRNDIEHLIESGYSHKGGIFHVLWVVAAALAIPTFLLTSGLGMKEMTREVGLLKAIGWCHREVLEKIFMENLLISLTAASLSVLLSMVWLKVFNGALIAQFYIAEVGVLPVVDIPSRYLPSHGLFCLVFALCVTLAGSLFSAWRHCRKPPVISMR
jgi:hypothetical protein